MRMKTKRRIGILGFVNPREKDTKDDVEIDMGEDQEERANAKVHGRCF